MRNFTKTVTLLMALGMTGSASAATYNFIDTSSILVTEGTSFNGSVNYSGLAGSVISATLTIGLSDDESSTFPNLVDTPIERARLTSVSGSGGGLSPNLTFEVGDNLFSAPFGLDIDNPLTAANELGTADSYFNYDVTSLVAGTSGSLSFMLDALNTRNNWPFLLGGGGYIEDFNYESSTLSIETAPVPVPAAVWLLGSGLVGVFGFSREKSETV